MGAVTTTDFFTHCCKNKARERALRLLMGWVLLLAMATVARAEVSTDITQLHLERSEEGWLLSAQLQFEPAPAVEDALLKGIPMVFVYSADVLRERWYWYDKKVQGTERHMRLAYQALTRRWRLNVGPSPAATNGQGLVLNQTFDSLAQALSAIKRVSKWKVAEANDLDAAAKYKIDFRFRLDLGQLPRPFQIGALGQSEWDISASATAPLSNETGK